MKKVIKCRITEMPKKFFDPMPQVIVTLEGEDKERTLFSYYPDEVSFTENEFIGLTEDECRALFTKKDKDYLLN